MAAIKGPWFFAEDQFQVLQDRYLARGHGLSPTVPTDAALTNFLLKDFQRHVDVWNHQVHKWADCCSADTWVPLSLRAWNQQCASIFFVRARCLSAGLRSWVLLADQRGIEPPLAVCQRHKNAAIPTQPRGRLINNVQYIFLWPAPCAFRRVTTLRLTRLPRHDRGPVPGGIDPRLAVYARSWDGHYTTTRRDHLLNNVQVAVKGHGRRQAILFVVIMWSTLKTSPHPMPYCN